MALRYQITCQQCKETKDVYSSAGHYRDICHECEDKNRKKAKEKALGDLKLLSLEARIARIEEYLYDLDIDVLPDIKGTISPFRRIG